MYLRETRRTNRDGSVVSYLQLASDLQLCPPEYPTFQTDNAGSIPVARSRGPR
jgi:hypothetical protein